MVIEGEEEKEEMSDITSEVARLFVCSVGGVLNCWIGLDWMGRVGYLVRVPY